MSVFKCTLTFVLLVIGPLGAEAQTVCWNDNPYGDVLQQRSDRLLQEGTPLFEQAVDRLMHAADEGDEWAMLTLATLSGSSWEGALDSFRANLQVEARAEDATDLELLAAGLSGFVRSEQAAFLGRVDDPRYKALVSSEAVSLLNNNWRSPELREEVVVLMGTAEEHLERYLQLCPEDALTMVFLRGTSTKEVIDWEALVTDRAFHDLCLVSRDPKTCLLMSRSMAEETYPMQWLWEYVFSASFSPLKRLALASSLAELEGNADAMKRTQDAALTLARRSGTWCIEGNYRHEPWGVLKLRWEAEHGTGAFSRHSLSRDAVAEYIDILELRASCEESPSLRAPQVYLRGMLEGIMSYGTFLSACEDTADRIPFIALVCAEGAVWKGDMKTFERYRQMFLRTSVRERLASPAMAGYWRDAPPNPFGEEDKVVQGVWADTLSCFLEKCDRGTMRGLADRAQGVLEDGITSWSGNMLAPTFALAASKEMSLDSMGFRRVALALRLPDLIGTFDQRLDFASFTTEDLSLSKGGWLTAGSNYGWSWWQLAATKLETFRFTPAPPASQGVVVDLQLPRVENLNEIASVISTEGVVLVDVSAEWCPGCRAEMKFLLFELMPLLQQAGVEMRVVSVDALLGKFTAMLTEETGLEEMPDGVFFWDRDMDSYLQFAEGLGLSLGVPTNLVFVDGQLVGWTFPFPPGQDAGKVVESILKLRDEFRANQQ